MCDPPTPQKCISCCIKPESHFGPAMDSRIFGKLGLLQPICLGRYSFVLPSEFGSNALLAMAGLRSVSHIWKCGPTTPKPRSVRTDTPNTATGVSHCYPRALSGGGRLTIQLPDSVFRAASFDDGLFLGAQDRQACSRLAVARPVGLTRPGLRLAAMQFVPWLPHNPQATVTVCCITTLALPVVMCVWTSMISTVLPMCLCAYAHVHTDSA